MEAAQVHGIESRVYQEVLFAESVAQNSLIVLPTGLGKTMVMLRIAAFFLSKDASKKVLIATPTRPLVHQIAETFTNHLNIDPELVLEIDGTVNPLKREHLYSTHQVIVSTPQTLANDFLAGKLLPADFQLLCLDEAHRATGNYAYVKMIQLFEVEDKLPRVIAFTATPGNSKEQILEVIKNLRIKAVLSKFEDDPDVRPYVSEHKPKIEWVELPKEYRDSLKIIEKVEKDLVKEIESRGLVVGKYLSKSLAMDLQNQASVLMREDPEKGELLNYTPNLIRILHLREIIETQGFPQASATLRKWIVDPQKKTLRDFLENPLIKELFKEISTNPIPHPKLSSLLSLVNKNRVIQGSKTIIFSNYRDTVDFIYDELTKAKIYCKRFIGQAGSGQTGNGMKQKEQIEVLTEFRDGDLDVLISTSVGEEGLDVGSCDLVVFYDSVPSIVRSVQRTGRGRKRRSIVVR
ncbi:MAG TPA: DEAD/DEAH box helicase family protein, partial [Candidatus Hodarchaeales archaeon]|nr:DEAD/DEAH box helicase family protein [Candidatus Hodarchaeales archaeon]